MWSIWSFFFCGFFNFLDDFQVIFSEPIRSNESMVLITSTGPAAEYAGELKCFLINNLSASKVKCLGYTKYGLHQKME